MVVSLIMERPPACHATTGRPGSGSLAETLLTGASPCPLRRGKPTWHVGEGAYIAPSARKHGIGDQDMLHALTHPLRVFDLDDGFTMLVAADTAGRLLEVGVVEGDTALGHRPRHARPPEVPEVMIMPRTVQDNVDHGDKLAKRFEDYEPRSSDARPPEAFVALRRAALERVRGPKACCSRPSTRRATTGTPGAPSGHSSEPQERPPASGTGPSKKPDGRSQ